MGSRHTVRKFMHHSHGMGRTKTHTLNHKFSINLFFLENRFDIFSRPISNLPRWVIGWETVTRQWDADATDLQVLHHGDHTRHLSKEASWSTWTIDLQQNLGIWFLTAIGVVFNNSTIIGLKGTAECQPKGFEKPRAYKWSSFKAWLYPGVLASYVRVTKVLILFTLSFSLSGLAPCRLTETPLYSSSHNHGNGEWVPPRLVSFTIGPFSSIFHFHDYGRKGSHDSDGIRRKSP